MIHEGQHLGEFEILERIGQGSMGAVYKARQTTLRRFVAIKTLQPALASDAEYVARFRNEAVAAAGLNHPNLVQVYSAGEADGLHYFAMEYVEGESAQGRLKRKGRIKAGEAIAIVMHVATALEYGWRKAQLIHRDIKPDNIFLSGDGEVKLGDLGLAKSLSQPQGLTMPGASMGTPHYISPEQAEGKEDIDLRTDIYSLGCTLYHLLSGQPPYAGDSAVAVMMKHMRAPVPDLRSVWPECPEEVSRVVMKMMRKLPGERQQGYGEVITGLRSAHEEATTAVASPRSPLSEAAKSDALAEKTATAWLDEKSFNARFPVNHRAALDALGQGYRASDLLRDGEPVSVQTFDPSLTRVPMVRREFEARAAAAAAHPHPNLLTPVAYTGGVHDLLIAMPWTEGFTLLDLLKERGALSPGEILCVLDPLARAADHAAGRKLMGLDFSKGQVVAHFPGGLSGEARAEILATPVDQWPAFEIKAGTLSLSDLGSESGGLLSLTSMATMAPATACPASLAPVPALAALACELLSAGGTGTYAPIAKLSENANAVLRRALSETGAFPNATAFAAALRVAIGTGGTSASPLRPKKMNATPAPVPPASKTQPPQKKRVLAVMVLLAVASLAACYWFGIHLPRERERGTSAPQPPLRERFPGLKKEWKLDVQQFLRVGMNELPKVGQSFYNNSVATFKERAQIAVDADNPELLKKALDDTQQHMFDGWVNVEGSPLMRWGGRAKGKVYGGDSPEYTPAKPLAEQIPRGGAFEIFDKLRKEIGFPPMQINTQPHPPHKGQD